MGVSLLPEKSEEVLAKLLKAVKHMSPTRKADTSGLILKYPTPGFPLEKSNHFLPPVGYSSLQGDHY